MLLSVLFLLYKCGKYDRWSSSVMIREIIMLGNCMDFVLGFVKNILTNREAIQSMICDKIE
jgi:hypothetical protein